MRALSIIQPWAWLIVNGHKDIENRTWHTHRRGTILVHAGKSIDHAAYEFLGWHHPAIADQVPGPKEIERGGIVGCCTILGCVERSESPWFFGPFGFVLGAQRPLPFAPLRGQLGFFYVHGYSESDLASRGPADSTPGH